MRLVATPPLAVIDIGSNSGRVAVLALTDDGHLEMLSDARTSLHLIDDVAASGRLSGEAIERVVRSVHDFLCIAATAHAERTVAVATAAVREASNGDELAERLLVETGITLEIIEGADEAHYALVGAVHGLAVEDGMLVAIAGLSRDRADTVTGGGVAVLTVMDWIQARSLMVSGQGLREGVALEHTTRLRSSAAARRASVTALVSRFTTWEEGRATRRRRIAATLLDGLLPHVDDA